MGSSQFTCSKSIKDIFEFKLSTITAPIPISMDALGGRRFFHTQPVHRTKVPCFRFLRYALSGDQCSTTYFIPFSSHKWLNNTLCLCKKICIINTQLGWSESNRTFSIYVGFFEVCIIPAVLKIAGVFKFLNQIGFSQDTQAFLRIYGQHSLQSANIFSVRRFL